MGARVIQLDAPHHASRWDWASFQGSASALRWNRRDLDSIDAVLPYVKGRTLAVQAGGNLGMFPKYLSPHFATVITFEPAADLFAMLMHNAPEPNIIKLQAAVGEVHELVGLSRIRRDGKLNNHEGITHVSGPGPIPTLRIDDLNLPVCDLIYLDTEGWELAALKGAVETLTRCRPVLAVEINKNAAFVGYTRQDVLDLLVPLGYCAVLKVHSDEVFVPCS